MNTKYPVSEIVKIFANPEVEGEASVEISAIASLEKATPSDLSFLGNKKYAHEVPHTKAGAVLLPRDYTGALPEKSTIIRVDNPSALLDSLPTAVNTPELQIPMAEGENKRFIEKIRAAAKFDDAEDVILIDGLRVEFKDGFALARASNTTPVVVLRVEGDTPEALERIKTRFAAFLKSVDPTIQMPF